MFLFRFLLLFGLLCTSLPLQAQVLVSPRQAWESFGKQPKFFSGFDSHRSFISNRDVSIFGVRMGLEFDDRVRLGIGVYFLMTPYSRNFMVPQPAGPDTLMQARLRLTHLSYLAEYVIFFSKRWEVSVPITLGLGEAHYPEVPGFRRQQFLMSSATLRADYKIFPFLGLAGGLGYRRILVGAPFFAESFNAPVYTFGLKLWLGWFAKIIFPPKDGLPSSDFPVPDLDKPE